MSTHDEEPIIAQPDDDDVTQEQHLVEEEEEEEHECRVCRGPEEEGRPFYHPCKCSGSIAYTHHDCLVEWLQYTGKKRCELCSHNFEFRPMYAPDTPDHLPTMITFRALAKHMISLIPYVLAVLMSVATWLIVVPLITAHVYYGWLNSPKIILDRYAYLGEDIVSGIVISVCIVISFLSVMSFVDFLRFHLIAQHVGDDARVRGQGFDEAAADLIRDLPPEIARDEILRQFPELANELNRGQDGAGFQRMDNQARQPRGNRGRAGRGNPMQQAAGQQDDEIEIHLALNELLGLHAPLVLIRNAIWYTCFIVLYLGIVVYLPWKLGGFVLNAMPVKLDFPKTEHLLTLPDLVTIFTGYASQVVLGALSYGLIISVKKISSTIRKFRSENDQTALRDNEYYSLITSILQTSLKIITFLFIKMAFLPLLIGVILDLTTLTLFTNISLETRLHDVFHNVVVSIILHWVMGITFMLIVTVSVLQLREVMHPSILKNVIKPQEQNIDLLGNLLNESNFTHVKKILDSMAIYISLLLVHVFLPIKILSYMGLQPTWEIQNVYLFGNLGRFIELLVFHLSMLGFLERFRNQIGKFQHSFLRKFCHYTGLTKNLLPCHILRFDGVGVIAIFESPIDNSCDDSDSNYDDDDVTIARPYNPLWNSLADPNTNVRTKEALILKSLDTSNIKCEPMHSVEGFIWEGRRVLESKTNFSLGSALVPSSIGRYRLQHVGNEVVVYEEVPDTKNPIPRPPHNWDDLAGGDAEAQGRWSWHDETPSIIERATAHRTPITPKQWPKVALLLLSSWVTTVSIVFFGLTAPLNTGRLLFNLFNIHPHDPIGFVIGGLLLGGIFFIAYSINCTKANFGGWIKNFRVPPIAKIAVVLLSLVTWFMAIPFFIGCIYCSWLPFEWNTARIWAIGSIIFHTWTALCYFEIFTIQFWENVGVLHVRNLPQNEVGLWQGRRGHIGTFYQNLREIVIRWEWDKVDRVTLLDNFAVPIALNISFAHMIPTMIAFITDSVMYYRIFSTVMICSQVAFYRQDNLRAWFAKMEKVARDDLYLIGETLVNYQS